MWGNIIGAGIGAAASLIGGRMASRSQESQTAANIAQQREFAQHGIRWRVDDAREAGVHPLYALGAQTHSFQPSAIGGSPMGSALADAGQGIGDAIARTQTRSERSQVQQQAAQMGHLQLTRARLENQLIQQQILASQMALFNQYRSPPFPDASPGGGTVMPGQGDAPLTMEHPRDITRSLPTAPHQVAGETPDVGFSRDQAGRLLPMPTDQEHAEMLETITPARWYWYLRHYINPIIDRYGQTQHTAPPQQDPGPGMSWAWNWRHGGWEAVPDRRGPTRPQMEVDMRRRTW